MRKIDWITWTLITVVATLSIVHGTSIWLEHPVVVNGDLLVDRLIIHLAGSLVMLAMNVGLIWWTCWFLREYEDA